jgi:hypothetical protein
LRSIKGSAFNNNLIKYTLRPLDTAKLYGVFKWPSSTPAEAGYSFRKRRKQSSSFDISFLGGLFLRILNLELLMMFTSLNYGIKGWTKGMTVLTF